MSSRKTFGTAGVLGILGFVGGLALSPTPASGGPTCEQDECEDGWFKDSCQDNMGQNTYCEFQGDGCFTGACSG